MVSLPNHKQRESWPLGPSTSSERAKFSRNSFFVTNNQWLAKHIKTSNTPACASQPVNSPRPIAGRAKPGARRGGVKRGGRATDEIDNRITLSLALSRKRERELIQRFSSLSWITYQRNILIAKAGGFNPDFPLAPNPFALSLSKGCPWFDKLTTNGLLCLILPDGQSGFNLMMDNYSHSMVAGGLPEMSYTTRLMPRISLIIRFETLASNVYGSSAQCAVMKSWV